MSLQEPWLDTDIKRWFFYLWIDYAIQYATEFFEHVDYTIFIARAFQTLDAKLRPIR